MFLVESDFIEDYILNIKADCDLLPQSIHNNKIASLPKYSKHCYCRFIGEKKHFSLDIYQSI